MNTSTATRTPSTDPMALVHVDAMAQRTYLPGDQGFRCQAITASRSACSRPATVWAQGRGPRMSAPANLCKAHGNSRFLVDADPSL